MTTKKNLSGTICLVLTNYSNENHVYMMPVCVFNPNSPIKILGIPLLESSLETMKMYTFPLQKMALP